MAKAVKFHDMKTDELLQELNNLKEKLFRFRFSHATRQLENPLELTKCKKDIARVKTILTERKNKAQIDGGEKAVKAEQPVKKPKAVKKGV